MKLYKYLLLALFCTPAFAENHINGYIEAKKYFMTNLPEYPDLQGKPVRYGVDFEIHFPTYFDVLWIMAGADSNVGPRQFSQIAGRAGLIFRYKSFESGLYHRSNHSIDHTPHSSFISDNNFYLKYYFEVK